MLSSLTKGADGGFPRPSSSGYSARAETSSNSGDNSASLTREPAKTSTSQSSSVRSTLGTEYETKRKRKRVDSSRGRDASKKKRSRTTPTVVSKETIIKTDVRGETRIISDDLTYPEDGGINPTTAEGQLVLCPQYSIEEAKREAKREYNRRNAIRSRQRSKKSLHSLQQRVDDLFNKVRDLQLCNQILESQLVTLQSQNDSLVTRSAAKGSAYGSQTSNSLDNSAAAAAPASRGSDPVQQLVHLLRNNVSSEARSRSACQPVGGSLAARDEQGPRASSASPLPPTLDGMSLPARPGVSTPTVGDQIETLVRSLNQTRSLMAPVSMSPLAPFDASTIQTMATLLSQARQSCPPVSVDPSPQMLQVLMGAMTPKDFSPNSQR